MIALLFALALDAGIAPDAGVASQPAPAAQEAVREATPLALDVQVTPEEVALGDHVQVRIAVDHDARDVYALPPFNPAPLAVPQGAPAPRVHREEVDGHARTVFELTLADYGTLEPRLPDLKFEVTGPAGERALSIRGRPLKFRSQVAKEKAPNAEQAHHGPKPPVPVLVPSLLWLWLLLGLAALVAAFFVLRYLRRRQPLPAARLVPAIPADEEALQSLEALKKDAAWRRGEGRAAIFRLSEVMRTYLGARLSFNALDLTSEELIAELRRRRLMGLDLAELIEEVRWEDLVKFARLDPTEEECLRGITRAELMVRHTRQLPPVQGAAA